MELSAVMAKIPDLLSVWIECIEYLLCVDFKILATLGTLWFQDL